MKRKICIMLYDLLITAILLGGIYGVNYRLPQKGVKAQSLSAKLSEERQATFSEVGTIESKSLPVKQDWRPKFADKFTDQIVSTDTSYSSPNVSIQLNYESYETNRLDTSENGAHRKYGTKISYVLADIYIGDITCLQTCFGQDTYGVGYSEKLTDMSARMKSILAVNGDSYSNSRHRDNGTIIRNGGGLSGAAYRHGNLRFELGRYDEDLCSPGDRRARDDRQRGVSKLDLWAKPSG